MKTNSPIIQALLISHPGQLTEGMLVEEYGKGLIFVASLNPPGGTIFFVGGEWRERPGSLRTMTRIPNTSIFYRKVTGSVKEFIQSQFHWVDTALLLERPNKFQLRFRLQKVTS